MLCHNTETIDIELSNTGYFFKAIANDHAVAFFSGSIQHRDMKVGGLSYEDGYKGNALACIIKPGTIEIRYHSDFTDSEVVRIFTKILYIPKLDKLKDFTVTYQGRTLI